MLHKPMWKNNLAICVTVVALVAGYFFYQARSASEQFLRNSREHSKVLAAAVELNIRNAMRSNDGLELIVSGFLKNSAHLISYINGLEQFTASDLSAFAREAGLAGITIVSDDGRTRVEGPENWGLGLDCSSAAGLVKHEAEQLYSLVYAADRQGAAGPGQGCVIIGFGAGEVERVQKDVSVETLLERLERLPGIASVQLVPAESAVGDAEPQLARLVERDGQRFSETRLRLGEHELIVTQFAEHFAGRLQQMRTQFFIFVAFLAAFGSLSSWWLYHAERLRLREARAYEQEMARQHEAAALGRAAATIAHEIRNPLNAIGMGLQRLQLEAAEGLDEEHHGLLAAMREAVGRSNAIVAGLQQYVRPFELTAEAVDITALLRNVLQLYATACGRQGIDVVLSAEEGYVIFGDRGLLGQLFENVIKNAVEAQPQGGFCHIAVRQSVSTLIVTITNGGFTLGRQESTNIFEPYFTSKTKGTGLGLAISRKIVEAHGGSISSRPDTAAQELTLLIELPLRPFSPAVEPPWPAGGTSG